MVDKTNIVQTASEWMKGKAYFLVDVTVSPDNRIVVEIDHPEGVWIEDCAELSRYIEAHVDRETEDYELEVGSAGIGAPFKVKKQYEIHIGHNVEVLTYAGVKYTGTLSEVTDKGFSIQTQQKVKPEGSKRPKMQEVSITFTFDEVKHTKYLISFK